MFALTTTKNLLFFSVMRISLGVPAAPCNTGGLILGGFCSPNIQVSAIFLGLTFPLPDAEISSFKIRSVSLFRFSKYRKSKKWLFLNFIGFLSWGMWGEWCILTKKEKKFFGRTFFFEKKNFFSKKKFFFLKKFFFWKKFFFLKKNFFFEKKFFFWKKFFF